eukprot:122785_1
MFNFKTMIAALCLLLIRTNAWCTIPSYINGLTPPPGSPCDITKNQYWCPTTKGCVEFISEAKCPQCDESGLTNFCQEDGTTKQLCCEKYDECNPSPDCYPATKWVTSSTEGEAKDKEMCGNTGSNGMWYCLSMKKCMRTETGTKCPICNNSGYIWNTAKSQCCKYAMSPAYGNGHGHFAAAQTISGNFDDASDSSCKKEYEMCANESECCAEAKYCLYEMCLACKPNGELCANNDECCNGPCVQEYCNGPSKSN